MTKRKVNKEDYVLVSFHVDNDMLRDLDELSRTLGINRSELIRFALFLKYIMRCNC